MWYNIWWGFTKACNLRCKHCYNSSWKRWADELSLEEAKLVVDKLAVEWIDSINYGTWECGLLEEFWELVEYVGKKWILQWLTSNGASIRKDKLDIIIKYFNDIDISIDYPNEIEHNTFRVWDNAWRDAITALDILKENDMDFSIVTCIHGKNNSEHYLDWFIDLVKKYGCSWRINWFRPTWRGKENEELKLDPLRAHEVFDYIASRLKILAIPDPYFSAITWLNTRKWCPCGESSFRITPSGKVVPCVYFTKEMDNLNIKTSSVKEIITSKPFTDLEQRNPELCSSCEYFTHCKGGCSSRAYLERYKLEDQDAFCYKKAWIQNNPLHGKKYTYEPEGTLVHDNYLCTVIFKP